VSSDGQFIDSAIISAGFINALTAVQQWHEIAKKAAKNDVAARRDPSGARRSGIHVATQRAPYCLVALPSVDIVEGPVESTAPGHSAEQLPSTASIAGSQSPETRGE